MLFGVSFIESSIFDRKITIREPFLPILVLVIYDKRGQITADGVNAPIYFSRYNLWKTVIGKNNQYFGDNI